MIDACDGQWHPIKEVPIQEGERFGYDRICLVAPGYAGHPCDPGKYDGEAWFTADGQEHELEPQWFLQPPLPPV